MRVEIILYYIDIIYAADIADTRRRHIAAAPRHII